jgi:hypothetical protein
MNAIYSRWTNRLSLYTCIPGTQEFDALIACGVVVSSPLANKVHSSFVLKGRKDCGMIVRAPVALVKGLELDVNPSIWIICLEGEKF